MLIAKDVVLNGYHLIWNKKIRKIQIVIDILTIVFKDLDFMIFEDSHCIVPVQYVRCQKNILQSYFMNQDKHYDKHTPWNSTTVFMAIQVIEFQFGVYKTSKVFA